MIPDNKKDVVRQALQTAFGVGEFENIEQLTKGLSVALVFKITIKGQLYLLRIITRTDAMADPTYYFGCMQNAAEAGIAPKIHYLNIEERISITDFIMEKPFPISNARKMMADTLRTLHSLPKFPFKINYIDASENFVLKFKSSNILSANETKEIFELYEQIGNVYPRNDQENFVSSHNDVKPDNIIFDGVKVSLIDWEAAFLNDRYVDLAAIANFVVKNEKDESYFLENYFGCLVDEYNKARFFLMSQIVHMFCFAICIMTGSDGKAIELKNIEHNSFNDFHDRLWNCEISLTSNEAKLQYALVHMDKLLHNMKTSRYKESLKIVSDFHKST